MALDTIIQQGYFTSDGTDKILTLRSDVDWVEVHNLTNIEGSTQYAGLTWTWHSGMGPDDALTMYHPAADQTVAYSSCSTGYNGAVYRGITLLDSTDKSSWTAPIAVTAGTNATQPVYDTGDTDILAVGGIVRVSSSAHTNVNGLDFSVSAVTADTDFTLGNALQQAPGAVAGANGYWQLVAPSVTVYDMFRPKKRVIANITQANPGVVTTLVDHNYQTGDKIRLSIPSINGMTELDDVLVTVTRVNASTFSIGLDTSAYTAFVFPDIADILANVNNRQNAFAVPVGQADATPFENTGFIGVVLGTSAAAAIALGSPGGTANDVIYWRAGRSFSASTS